MSINQRKEITRTHTSHAHCGKGNLNQSTIDFAELEFISLPGGTE
jgi:hypothetical protein